MFMKTFIKRSALFVTLIFSLTVCGIDAPTAAAPPPPDMSLLGDLTGTVTGTLSQTVSSLLRPLACNTRGYGSVTKTIGRSGGQIVIGPHSFVVAPNALSSDVAITATAPQGNRILVQFQPAGLVFNGPAALTLSYRECGILVLKPKVVYTTDGNNILEVLLTVPNILGRTATGKVGHFSAYMLAEN